MPWTWHRKLRLAAAGAAFLLVPLAACGPQSAPAGRAGTGETRPALRLGYLPNLTQAPALLGIHKRLFETAAGRTGFDPKSFSAGPSAVEALFAGALDAAYLGPGPAINAHVRSRGRAIRIVAGATEGGSALVVHPSVRSARDFEGEKVATPQLGNTQDIALRRWLKSHGLTTNLQGGGEVSVVPQENAQTLETFRIGEIAGAWVPEPWVSRLREEAGGKVLVDERSLWPGGRFPTTVLVVHKDFLDDDRALVEQLLRAHLEAIRLLNSERDRSLEAVNQRLGREIGKPLPRSVLNAAAANLRFTSEVVPSHFTSIARAAKDLGLLETDDVDGAFLLDPLHELVASSPGPHGS